MNLDEVRDQIAADNDGKWDTLLDVEEMRFHNGRLIFPRLYRADHPNGLALTKWATAQVCHRLNMPIAYFRRCPLHLQDAQANHWLCLQQTEAANRNGSERNGKNGRNGHSGRDRWFLRAKNDVLRGALSERYTRLDNTDLLTSLLPSLDARFEVGWFAITDESLHLRLLDPTLARDVLPNDRLVAGLHIANSEVGKRSVTVDALVYRLVCANGLVRLVKGKSLLQRRRVAITTARMELALKTALREALMQSTGFMERLSWATSQHVSEMPDVLDTLTTQWGLSQTLRGKVQEAILAEPRHQHETLYGLVNGLTSAAQGLEADERYTLETLAGKLLESGPPRPQAKNLGAVSPPTGLPPALPATMPSALNEDLEEELSLFAGERLTLGRPIK
jgi:hypothetical protein